MYEKNRLLSELRRLLRAGIVNDEEYIVLTKLIASKSVSKDMKNDFERLFPEQRIVKNEEESISIDDLINSLFGTGDEKLN